MEQLKNINYMYFVYAACATLVLIIACAIYMTYGKTNCQECTRPNALMETQKSTEGFDSNGNSEETGPSKREQSLVEGEEKIKGELVLYYAMWCGYSRSFLPEFEKFEKFAKENLPHVRVMKIRCEDGNEATCSQKGVNGFPSVILYVKNGQEKTFDKERNMQKLVEFVNENL